MSDDARIDEVLADWRAHRDRGDPLDPETVIRQHADLAEPLRRRFRALAVLGEATVPAASPSEPRLRTLPTGRYTDYRVAGEGGMGLVYWAIDTDLNREVALKVIRPEAWTAGPGTGRPDSPLALVRPSQESAASKPFESLRDRFLQEAWLTGGLSHPGIVPVYEMGQTPEGIPYYTMRFVRGERTLRRAIDEAATRGIEARLALLEPFLKVCDTLAYAHARGVIHRDLKPENIALGEYGEVIVLDWGLAKLKSREEDAQAPWQDRIRSHRDERDFKTMTSAIGTPGYMSLEAAKGNLKEVDERSDVFALGAILFFVLTGRPPWTFGSYVEYVRTLMREDAPFASSVDPSVPRGLSDICARALARSKADRPAGAAAVSAAVRAWQVQSESDRETAAWLGEAGAMVETASGLAGEARLRALDRASALCTRVLDRQPDDPTALERRRVVEGLRERGVRERERAARRGILKRAGALALVVATGVTALVALAIDRKGQETEQALRRARVLGLVSASAGASDTDPMLALLLATEAVRRGPSSPLSLSRLEEAVATSRERLTMTGHERGVVSLALLPEDRGFVSGSKDGTARMWDAEGRPSATFAGSDGEVREVAASPDGARVAMAMQGGTAVVWTIGAPSPVVLRGHGGTVTSVAFSPDGGRLVTASEDRTARIWSLEGAEEARLVGHGAGVVSAVFTPSGDGVLTASDDGTARLWDRQGGTRGIFQGDSGELGTLGWSGASLSAQGDRVAVYAGTETLRVFDLHGQHVDVIGEKRGRPRAVAFSPSGDRILVGWSDHTAALYDRDGQEVATLRGHTGVVTLVEFAPQGNRVATGSWDQLAAVWDLQGQLVARLPTHRGSLVGLRFSSDGRRLVTASSMDLGPRVWDVVGGVPGLLDEHTESVRSASFSPDGTRVLTASHDGTARLWDRTGAPLVVLRGHEMALRHSSFSPDGTRVVTASADGTARIWDVAGNSLAVLPGHGKATHRAIYTPKGDRIVTTGFDGVLRIWDADGRLLHVVGQTSDDFSSTISPAGDLVAGTAIDHSVHLWDLEGVERAVLSGHTRQVLEILFAPDGQRLVSVSADGTGRIWGRDGKVLATLEGHEGMIRGLSVSSDGKWIATGSDDATIRLWDWSGRLVRVLRGHLALVRQVRFSARGDRIISSSADLSARVWDLEGNELLALRGHQLAVSRAEFSPDGDWALTCSGDGTARLWPLRESELLPRAAARATRAFTPEERAYYGDLLSDRSER